MRLVPGSTVVPSGSTLHETLNRAGPVRRLRMPGFFFGQQLHQCLVTTLVAMRVICAHGNELSVATDVLVVDVIEIAHGALQETGLQVAR
jgi:hypothetical protein